MKIKKAHITNFRLLKDLRLDFSTDSEKLLTVIRAENESGKTTIKNALIWGFFGSKALPGRGADYALCPSDAISRGLRRVEISVEIEFFSDQIVYKSKNQKSLENCHFRLRRTCMEYPSVDGSVKRENETRTLYRITDQGTQTVPEIEVDQIIETSIPSELKDVYFTDGDQAMTFIEAGATTGVKRRRVQHTIEALLGLTVLDKTIKQLKAVGNSFEREIDNKNYRLELEKLQDRINGYEEDIAEWSEEEQKLEGEITAAKKDLDKTSQKVEELLKMGNKTELVNSINTLTGLVIRAQQKKKESVKSVASLTRNSALANSLAGPVASKGMEILQGLSDRKQLPKVSIPILEELVERDNCFCGEPLDDSTDEGKRRVQNIKSTIEDSRSADKIQEAATALFFSVRNEDLGEGSSKSWLDLYAGFDGTYASAKSDEIRYGKQLLDKKKEVDKIDDSKLDSQRKHQSSLSSQLERAGMRLGELGGYIKDSVVRKREAEQDKNVVSRKVDHKDTAAGKMHISRACEHVFQQIFERLRNEELNKVSEEMNRIFLKMIGSNPEANDLTLIKRAELTEEFDIRVYGPSENLLNPDQDLNGASRRAITLAFILALTKVSGVEAPNVIDTPLGMMSGFVKRSVVNRCLEEGSQVIMFLTPSEINGIESIISNKAGVIFTLTNPAHYPEILVNEPKVEDARIIRCDCDHLSACSICERKSEEIEDAA